MRPEDAALIDAYLDDDPEAAGTIGGWIERAAWPYRRRLGDGWEDLVNDVHLELTRLLRRGSFRGEARLKTFLWRVVNNACITRLRAARRRHWIDLEDVGETLEDEGLLARPASAGFGERDLVGRVLERVSVDCRRLWRMIYEGWSYAEMSEREGVREGTLRVRVLRCRKKAEAVVEELRGEGERGAV